jgi:hypothetical protein
LGPLAAALVTTGLALSLLPILLRVLPPLTRDLTRDLETEKPDPHLWVTVLGPESVNLNEAPSSGIY